jgi:ABC-type Fe3+-citrate transport system substrate-binding protein
MKKNNLLTIFTALISFSLLFTACNKDDNDSTDDTATTDDGGTTGTTTPKYIFFFIGDGVGTP